MSNHPQRRKSTLAIVDDGILVVVAIVGALFLFKIIGFLAGTVWFIFKVALLVGAVYAALRFVKNRVR